MLWWFENLTALRGELFYEQVITERIPCLFTFSFFTLVMFILYTHHLNNCYISANLVLIAVQLKKKMAQRAIDENAIVPQKISDSWFVYATFSFGPAPILNSSIRWNLQKHCIPASHIQNEGSPASRQPLWYNNVF